MFTDISVTIYWADIEELRKTSTVPEYSFFRDKDEPEEGMLEDELDVGQQSGNDYEKSKIQSEQSVRAASFTFRVIGPAVS